jgi:hypothetical protein
MGFLNKMERKFGKYAIPNLTRYIIFAYVLGYLIDYTARNILQYMLLDPYMILHGQVWRIITWLLIPPEQFSIFTLIMLFFYYSIGSSLENVWGDFRYNIYVIGGIITTILGAFLLYVVESAMSSDEFVLAFKSFENSAVFSTYYISLSIFLGFAMTFPDNTIYLFMILPIKIKYLAYLDIAYLLYAMYQSNWGVRVVIISSLLNVLIFFLLTRKYRVISPREVQRKRTYQKQVKPAPGVTKHKCAVCGRTEEDGEDLEFRFCSKCEGNYEYCQDHLFTHEHIRRS